MNDAKEAILPLTFLAIFVLLIFWGLVTLFTYIHEIGKEEYDRIAVLIKDQPEMKPVVNSFMKIHNSMQKRGITGLENKYIFEIAEMLKERPEYCENVYGYCKKGIDRNTMIVIRKEYKRLPVIRGLKDVDTERDNSGTDPNKQE